MRLNGDDNENNFFRPLDMNGNAIKTSTGNMTITSSTSGNLTMSSGTGGGSVNINGLGAYITTNGTAGDTLSLSSASTINLTATNGIKTDSFIETLSSTGGNKINFINGDQDYRFDIARNNISLFWNNAITDTATIVLENDQPSLNSAINMTYTTGSGNLGTTIQNKPTSQRILQTDGVNNKSYESSPDKMVLTESPNVRIAKIENSVNSGENRMDLYLNSGAGVVAQSGIVNQAGTQMLFLVHTDNATGKGVSVRQDTSGTGKVQYENTIDTNAFEITSVNTDLILSAPSTAGGGSNIEINPAGQLIFSPNLEQSSSTGSSGKFLKIKLNGVNYCIPLDFA